MTTPSSSSSPVHVVARHFARPETVAEVREILVGLIPLSRAEAGCLKYELFHNISDPTDFTFMETFASDAALVDHAAAPYVAGLQARLNALVAKPSDVRIYRPVAVEARDGRTTDPRWARVDDYLEELFVPPDAALQAAVESADAAGLPSIQVSATQGKLLQVIAKSMGARRILEIGTLGGYSAIWLARALPADGRLVTIELDPKHADVARANITRAGLADRVDIRVGRAIDILPRLFEQCIERADGAGPFDLTFIDADKVGYAGYLDWAIRLSRAGSLIIADNVIRDGAVTESTTGDAMVDGIRRFNAALAVDARVSATAIQTVGAKGYDGFTAAVVK
jgi:predicted O-methyltransferase YrrM/quinol monooxygenase YgiN